MAGGRATGVNTTTATGADGFVPASAVVLAASTVETPRLVLLSDQHGRCRRSWSTSTWSGPHLMTHHFPGGLGVFEERVDYWRGFWSMRCLDD